MARTSGSTLWSALTSVTCGWSGTTRRFGAWELQRAARTTSRLSSATALTRKCEGRRRRASHRRTVADRQLLAQRHGEVTPIGSATDRQAHLLGVVAAGWST